MQRPPVLEMKEVVRFVEPLLRHTCSGGKQKRAEKAAPPKHFRLVRAPCILSAAAWNVLVITSRQSGGSSHAV